MPVWCFIKFVAHSKNLGNTIFISVMWAINSLSPFLSLSGALGSSFLFFWSQSMWTKIWECPYTRSFLSANSRERTLRRQDGEGWLRGPASLAAGLRITHDRPGSSWRPLFTAAWWAGPLASADCWSCLRSPAWRAGCLTRPTGGPAQPGAIWMWATWTCDKKQKPRWGGRPSLQHKIKQPKEEAGRDRGEKKNAFQDTGEDTVRGWEERRRRNKL